ncbi:MAG: RsmE family RNA methyltransferase [bacterium]
MKHIDTNFFVPPENIQNGRVIFTEEESHHLAKVLRAKVDDIVTVVDGAGKAYQVVITRADKEHSRGEIRGETKAAPEPVIEFTLCFGAIKPKRLEWAWDACIQLGISRLIPLHTEYGIERIRPDGKFFDRLEIVSIRAMKQSLRAVLPEVESPKTIYDIINEKRFDHLVVADENGLPNLPAKLPKLGDSVSLFVGPEGGFSAEERKAIADAGGVPISLGQRRLRAETAAIALSTIALRWTGDL